MSEFAAAAGRLWAGAGGTANGRQAAAAAARVTVGLRVGLGRWIVGAGYRALLERAIDMERGAHPSLDAVPYADGDEAAIAAAITTQEPAAAADAVIALVTTLTGLLGRIVGEELAVRLVEQTASTGALARPAPDTTRGGNA